MTCFRLKDGSTVRSQVSANEYARFVRLIEKGYDTEEAFKEATKRLPKTVKAEMREALGYLPAGLEKSLRARMYRTKCSYWEAYKWAKDTGRAWKNVKTAKATLELLKKGYQDV